MLGFCSVQRSLGAEGRLGHGSWPWLLSSYLELSEQWLASLLSLRNKGLQMLGGHGYNGEATDTKSANEIWSVQIDRLLAEPWPVALPFHQI